MCESCASTTAGPCPFRYDIVHTHRRDCRVGVADKRKPDVVGLACVPAVKILTRVDLVWD